MLTVKVSESRNQVRGASETIFEARQVRKDGENIIVDHAEGGSSSYDVVPGSPEIVPGNEHFMFVMNRHGATVATYRL